MRRRVLGTTKILSVAVAILPGCEKPVVRADPTPAASVSAPVASSSAQPSPSAPNPELMALATELLREDPKKVDFARYRPLCDDKGYPLVGNLHTKEVKPTAMLVSELCAEVRKKQKP